MIAWLQAKIGAEVFGLGLEETFEELVEQVRLEVAIVVDHVLSMSSDGSFEANGEVPDVEEENFRLAQGVAYGYPAVAEEPVAMSEPGRFARSFPLELPTGAADPTDVSLRTIPVTAAEATQHLLRYRTGHTVEGTRGHRFVWALVNTLLVSEAAGKGFAVHRNVLKRLGGRLGYQVTGGQILRKSQLREMMKCEETMRSVVNQLMTVGRDVRSTPMHWAYEGKKLDAGVRYLSWLPPWVSSAGDDDGQELAC